MGWYEKQLLIHGAYVKFFDCLDKSTPTAAEVLIHTIVPDVSGEWIYQRSDSVDEHPVEFTGLLGDEVRFFAYCGYPWIFEDKPLMLRLLSGESVALKGSVFEGKTFDARSSGWNYVETQEDADGFLCQAYSFHDSVLNNLHYISGSYMDEKNSLHPLDLIRQITMRIDSEWCKPIEMVFEGVTALNLRPASDNQDSIVFEASLFVKDACVFFCDEKVDDFDEAYTGTWVKAYGLRWRFINK